MLLSHQRWNMWRRESLYAKKEPCIHHPNERKSHHHKYIDTFSIKFNYLRHKEFSRSWMLSMHSQFFFNLNLSHDLPITYRNWISFLKYDAHFFYWDIWGDLHGTGIYSFNNSWLFFLLSCIKKYATLNIV